MARQWLRNSEIARIGRKLEGVGFEPSSDERFAQWGIKYDTAASPGERLIFLMRYDPDADVTHVMFQLDVAADDYHGTRQFKLLETASVVYAALELIDETPQVLRLLRSFYADWREAMDAYDEEQRGEAPPVGDARRAILPRLGKRRLSVEAAGWLRMRIQASDEEGRKGRSPDLPG